MLDHYFATEGDFDGGNIKVSVNGGPYQPCPPARTCSTPHNDTLLSSQNTSIHSPTAGVHRPHLGLGNWGTLQIDLTRLAPSHAHVIRVRFDFGQDVCLGINGWYVDSVRLEACNAKKAPSQAVVGKEEPLAQFVT